MKLNNIFRFLETVGVGFLALCLIIVDKNVEGLILMLVCSINSLKYEVREIMTKYESEKWEGKFLKVQLEGHNE